MARRLAYFALVSLIWGLSWAAIKFGLQDLPPLLLAGARYLFAAILLLPTLPKAPAAFMEGRWPRTLASALLVNTGTYGLLFWGMQSVPSGLAGLVNLALVPVMLFALAVLTGEERPTWRHAVALTIGCAGLVALFWTRLAGEGAGSGIGLLAIIVATGCYCVGSIVARPLLGPVIPLALTMVQAAIGGAALLVISAATEPVNGATLLRFVHLNVLGSILFLSLLGTIVAYTLYLVLLRDWGSVRAGLYAFISPIIALVAGALLFGETVGIPEVIGAILLLIAAGVALLRTSGEGAGEASRREAT
ncbi:EamA family transporter [Mesorhizobium sp. M0152]|uniref:DMT family transporter n=1 Tax=Mesorhizobium sp. M0152 TaxID=2956898 RepID=UPI00333CC789